jgi:hypothetical protein
MNLLCATNMSSLYIVSHNTIDIDMQHIIFEHKLLDPILRLCIGPLFPCTIKSISCLLLKGIVHTSL